MCVAAGIRTNPPPGNFETSTSGGRSKGKALGLTGRLDWVVGNGDWAWHNSYSDNSRFVACATVGIRATPPCGIQIVTMWGSEMGGDNSPLATCTATGA
jgi:hypothetical protein